MPMLTLDEAVAKLDAELADAPLVARGILDITVLWQPKADAIRAAVRDVALAAVDETNLYCADLTKQKARIKCLLGDSPHG